MYAGFWCEKAEEKTGSGNKGIDGRIVLKRILRNAILGYGLDSSGSEQGPDVNFCEGGNGLMFPKYNGDFSTRLPRKILLAVA
jgi:hypothetical protein